jgi:hypothetical protein
MANGSTKAIKDVKVGDQVTATDPTTGTTIAEPVTQLHLNRDTDLTDLTLSPSPDATPAGRQGTGAGPIRGPTHVLHTTTHHPFWDATARQWVDAGTLTPGHQLAGPHGQTLYVAQVHNYTGAKNMHNLTIANLHTYYVIAGNVPVLVHNTGPECGPGLRTWQDAGIDPMDAARIQHTANQSHQSIIVVGSRAAGTAGVDSDWDYILTGPSKARQSVRNSLPRGLTKGNETSTGQYTGMDLVQNYNPSAPNFEELDANLPHVIFDPE